MADRVRVRPISNEEGNRLLRILRRGTGSVVTWRRAQMVLLAAQAMDAPQIAKVTFTSEDRVRDVIHDFNQDGFDSLYPRYKGGRPPKVSDSQREQMKRTRAVAARGSWAAVLDLEPHEAGRLSRTSPASATTALPDRATTTPTCTAQDPQPFRDVQHRCRADIAVRRLHARVAARGAETRGGQVLLPARARYETHAPA